MAEMTYNQIEARAERMMDALDRRYLSSSMNLATYESEVRAIKSWAELQHTYRIIGQNLERGA